MGSYLSIPILVLAAALQSGAVPQLRILGGAPDLVLLCVIAWAVNAKLEEGVVWAIVGGVLQDLLSSTPTGMSAVGMVLVVFMVNQFSQQVYGVGVAVIAIFVLAGTAIFHLVTLVLLVVTGGRVDPLVDLSYVVLPTLVYNFVFIWPIYWFLRRIQRRYALDRRFFT